MAKADALLASPALRQMLARPEHAEKGVLLLTADQVVLAPPGIPDRAAQASLRPSSAEEGARVPIEHGSGSSGGPGRDESGSISGVGAHGVHAGAEGNEGEGEEEDTGRFGKGWGRAARGEGEDEESDGAGSTSRSDTALAVATGSDPVPTGGPDGLLSWCWMRGLGDPTRWPIDMESGAGAGSDAASRLRESPTGEASYDSAVWEAELPGAAELVRGAAGAPLEIHEKPSDAAEARAFVRGYSGSVARTVSGLCLVHSGTGRRVVGLDVCSLRYATIPEETIARAVRGHSSSSEAPVVASSSSSGGIALPRAVRGTAAAGGTKSGMTSGAGLPSGSASSSSSSGNKMPSLLETSGSIVVEHPDLRPLLRGTAGTDDAICGLPLRLVSRMAQVLLQEVGMGEGQGGGGGGDGGGDGGATAGAGAGAGARRGPMSPLAASAMKKSGLGLGLGHGHGH